MSTENVQVIQEVDEALAAERASVEKRTEERLSAATKERDKISRIGSLLRYIGVGVLIASMATFMFQRWDTMTQVSRYFTFLAFTAGVCVSGLLCGLKIGENKGARTLLGAVVTLIPIHCAQIGAFIYSRVANGVSESSYPSYFYFMAPTRTDAVFVAVGGLLALLPMAYMAYSVLARKHAKQLLLLGCGVSAALLVPTRDPLFVAGLVAVAGALAYIGERSFGSIVELKTREAFVARLVPFIALAMLIGRQSSLYRPTTVLHGVEMALLSALLFGILPQFFKEKGLVWASENVSLITTMIAALLFGDAVISGFNLSGSFAAPLVVGLPLTVVYALMAHRAREAGVVFRAISALTLFVTGVAELLNGAHVEACLISLVIGIVGVTYACITENKGTLFAGVSLAVLSLMRVCFIAITSLSVSPWILLGVIGVGTILGASYLERNFTKIRENLMSAKRQVADWS
jgi:hypothetical protein